MSAPRGGPSVEKDALAARIRSEADIADRPGQFDRLNQIAREVERMRRDVRTAARLTDEQVDELVRLTDKVAAEDPYALDTLVGTVESWIDAARVTPPAEKGQADA